MDLSYYKMTPWQRFIFKTKGFFKGLGKGIVGFFVNIFKAIIGFFVGIGKGFKEFGLNFWRGDYLTKLSHGFMGLSHLFRGQVVRGIVYLVLEAAFVLYMALFGGKYIVMCFENFFVFKSLWGLGMENSFSFWSGNYFAFFTANFNCVNCWSSYNDCAHFNNFFNSFFNGLCFDKRSCAIMN